MKLQTPSVLLLRQALQKAAKGIESKPSVALLADVLLRQSKKDGKFFFVTGSDDTQLTIPAPLDIVEGSFSKPVVLPIVSITNLLGTLPPECVLTMDLSEDESHMMNIEYCTHNGDNVKSGNISLPFFAGDDFPEARDLNQEKTHISLPSSVFKSVISKAGKFVFNDDLRPILSTLCIDIAEDRSEVVFVATDGRILFKVTHSNNPETGGSNFYRSGEPTQILVHSSFFRTLSVFDDSEQIDIQTDGNAILFSGNDIEYLCKAVEGKYPNYKSVIPTNNPYYVVVDKKELISVVKRVALFSSASSHIVALKKDGMFLNVCASDIDFSKKAEDQVLITDSRCDDGFTIGFNYHNLLDTVTAIPDDTIRIQLADPSRAGVLTANTPAPTTLTLLMPILLEE